jgi:hypothetical protein
VEVPKTKNVAVGASNVPLAEREGDPEEEAQEEGEGEGEGEEEGKGEAVGLTLVVVQ